MRKGGAAAGRWHDALHGVRDRARCSAAARSGDRCDSSLSAHASHEELFLLKQLAEELMGDGGAAHVTSAGAHARSRSRRTTKFKVPAVDAPNVNGARDLGLAVGRATATRRTCRRLRTAVEPGASTALYVVDPGPDGSLGDVSWIIERAQRAAAAAR